MVLFSKVHVNADQRIIAQEMQGEGKGSEHGSEATKRTRCFSALLLKESWDECKVKLKINDEETHKSSRTSKRTHIRQTFPTPSPKHLSHFLRTLWWMATGTSQNLYWKSPGNTPKNNQI